MFKGITVATLCFLLTLSAGCLNGYMDVSGSHPGVLANLRKAHPRLLFTIADQRRIEKLAEKDTLLAEMIVQLKRDAERMLSEPTAAHEWKTLPKRYSTLRRGRTCVARMLTLSMAYRLTDDARFAERGRKELLAAAALDSWSPRHFLSTAEMCCDVAIGYDWLYDFLSPSDRTTIRSAIVAKALLPGMDVYTGAKNVRRRWSRWYCNQNMVGNGGLVLGALAVAEDEPEIAAKIISHALSSIKIAMATYSPDGAWHEGPVYWAYGTTYSALMIAALDSALGDDFGLSGAEGFNKAGLFRIHTIRPNGTFFNFSDCHSIFSDISPAMFWLARKFNRPAYAWSERRQVRRLLASHKQRPGSENKNNYFGPCRFYAMEIAWFDDRGKTAGSNRLPLDAYFRGKADVVTMRSAWDDEQALYVGFKGGDNRLSHPHMDIGSFVLDADGVGWGIEIGGDNYKLPGTRDKGDNGRRWNYFRLGPQGHNTLIIGGRPQRVTNSTSRIIHFLSTPARAHAVVDMTNAYRGQAKKVLRGVAMLDRSRVLIQDEVTCISDDEIRWGMLTQQTKIKLDGEKAFLTKDGRTLSAEILAPAGATFKIVIPPPPGEGEYPRPNISMLVIFVKPTGRKLMRLAVLLTPVGEKWKTFPPPRIKPLENWENR